MNDQARSKSKQAAESGSSSSAAGGRTSRSGRTSTKDLALRAAGQAKLAVTKRMEKPGVDIDKMAKSLRLTGQQLEGNVVVPYVDKLAGGLERVATFIEDADPAELIRAAERYARRRPFVFVGGAIGVGVIAGRFLKSSAAIGETHMTAGGAPATSAGTPKPSASTSTSKSAAKRS